MFECLQFCHELLEVVSHAGRLTGSKGFGNWEDLDFRNPIFFNYLSAQPGGPLAAIVGVGWRAGRSSTCRSPSAVLDHQTKGKSNTPLF